MHVHSRIPSARLLLLALGVIAASGLDCGARPGRNSADEHGSEEGEARGGCSPAPLAPGTFTTLSASRNGKVIWNGHELGGLVRYGTVAGSPHRGLYLLADSVDGGPSPGPLPVQVPRLPPPRPSPQVEAALTQASRNLEELQHRASDAAARTWPPGAARDERAYMDTIASYFRAAPDAVDSVRILPRYWLECGLKISGLSYDMRTMLDFSPPRERAAPRPKISYAGEHDVWRLDNGDLVVYDMGASVSFPGEAHGPVLAAFRRIRAGTDSLPPELARFRGILPHLWKPLSMKEPYVEAR